MLQPAVVTITSYLLFNQCIYSGKTNSIERNYEGIQDHNMM